MRGFNNFSCKCGKEFTDFDEWFNHMCVSKHIILTDEDIEKLREFVIKIAK